MMDIKTVGSVILTEVDAIQFNASVTVTVTFPEHIPDSVVPFPPVDHRYVYGDVPPAAKTVAVPLHNPLQVIFELEEILAEGAPVLLIFIVFVDVHPLASVTVTVYAPATTFDIELVV